MNKKIKDAFKISIIVIGSALMVGTVGYSQNHRTIDATITDCIETKDGFEYEVTDATYNVWLFYGEGSQDYEVNQKVKVTFDTNTTDNITTDDVIVNVK